MQNVARGLLAGSAADPGLTLGDLRASGPEGEQRASQLWVALVATNRFIIEGAGFARVEPLDYLDTLLMIALIQANIAPLMNDRDLQLRYATAESAPPDDVRRAISVTALAGSLGLPFETVRRRLGRLNALGYCEPAERGYRVPARLLDGPDYLTRIGGAGAIVRDIYLLLRDAGCLEGLAGLPAEYADGEPIRVVARAAGDYALRVFTVMTAEMGDPLDVFMVMALMHINTGGDPCVVPGWPLAPARVARLAEKMQLPYETVRRRLSDLAGRRLCARTARGWIVPGDHLAAMRVDLLEQNLAHLRRFFATLGRFGILSAWDASTPA